MNQTEKYLKRGKFIMDQSDSTADSVLDLHLDDQCLDPGTSYCAQVVTSECRERNNL